MADEAKAGPSEEGERQEPKSEGRPLTWLWMILALVVVGGFLTWLGMASEPTSVAVTEGAEAEDEEEALDGDVVVVPKDTLADDKSAYEGLRIRVSDVEATAQLGPSIFWGELGDPANQVPILVRVDSAAAQDWEMRQGTRYTITGQLERMTDSVAVAWGEQGEFAGEGEQMQATFTDYFIQASRIRPTRGQASREGAGGGAGSPDSEG